MAEQKAKNDRFWDWLFPVLNRGDNFFELQLKFILMKASANVKLELVNAFDFLAVIKRPLIYKSF